MHKRFSLKNKLILIFGLLIVIATSIEGILAVRIARNTVIEKVSIHLTDKAEDTASIIDGNITSFFQLLAGAARTPLLSDPSVSYEEKAAYLNKEADLNPKIHKMSLCDMQGKRHTEDQIIDVSDRDFFIAASQGKNFVTEPLVSRLDGHFVITFSVPVYDDNHTIVAVLIATVETKILSDDISNIVVGKTGYCYIIGPTGTCIGHKDYQFVEKQVNALQLVRSDASYKDTARFIERAMTSTKNEVDYYNFKNIEHISSFAKMETSQWTVIISAPVEEFTGAVSTLRITMLAIGVAILLGALVVVYFIASAVIKPILTTVNALQGIAQGEGDLTVRLPIHGNDEITDLSEYFNQTIAKIGSAIKSVDDNSGVMQSIGDELSSNMTETASALNEISANIEGVKEQAMTQAASVTETAGTVGTIIHTIEHLNESIESQSASVVQSSAAVEEMVSNIASITQSLEKSDNMIKMLATATSEGKTTLQNSNAVTQKIAEASGGLIEASSVIQNIASQTNLLAMNAAIEAAHAGEAGKGFAVVADEIRKLAEESSAQGKAITDTLKKLSDEIAGLSESSKTVEEKFNAIFQLSENVRGMSAELTAAMKEQENGSREVLAAIKTISSVTAEVKDGSEEMLTGGRGVAQEMQKLDRLTAEIKDSMNEMSAGVQQINNAVQEVNDLARKNKDSIEGLASEVRKFKV